MVFYRYGGHVRALFGPILTLSFPRKKIAVGKKDHCAVFGCNNERLFPEKFSFCPKSARKYFASAH